MGFIMPVSMVIVLLIVLLSGDKKSKTIYGVVTDIVNTPLSNVKVVSKEAGTYTFTNDNGFYKISLPKSASTLFFYKKGMKKAGADIDIHNKNDIRMASKNSSSLSDMAIEDLLCLEVSPENYYALLEKIEQ